MSTIGVIGAGAIGSNMARLAIAAGHRVVISNSRGPHTLGPLVAALGDRARAATATDAALAGDIVVAAIPFGNIGSLPIDALAGRIVIDTHNYFPMRDGWFRSLDTAEGTTAGLLQQLLPGSRVVKAFSHIRAADLTADSTPPGSRDRRALAVFGDDADARATVTDLVDRFGFDPVDGGPLSESWRSERGQPSYVFRLNAEALTRRLALARRVPYEIRPGWIP